MSTTLRDEADTAVQLAAAIRTLDCPEGWRAVKLLIGTGDEVAAFALRWQRWPRRFRLLAAAPRRDGPGLYGLANCRHFRAKTSHRA
jgi:hypothetical protein